MVFNPVFIVISYLAVYLDHSKKYLEQFNTVGGGLV